MYFSISLHSNIISPCILICQLFHFNIWHSSVPTAALSATSNHDLIISSPGRTNSPSIVSPGVYVLELPLVRALSLSVFRELLFVFVLPLYIIIVIAQQLSIVIWQRVIRFDLGHCICASLKSSEENRDVNLLGPLDKRGAK